MASKVKWMTKRRKGRIAAGMQFGDLEVIRRVATKSGSSGGQKWMVKCSCGTTFTLPQFYLVRPEFPKRHCGCRTKREGPKLTRERGIFYMMHRRCYNPTHVAYPHYGGANPPIGVCDAWNKDKVGNDQAWANFFKDMGPAPSRKHTLDRINPHKGYGWQPSDPDHPLYPNEVLNCRWATADVQANNMKKHWKKPESVEAAIKAEASLAEDVGDGDGEDDGE